MRKTTVYLTDEQAEGLRRLTTATGRPQAQLIREGVRRVIAEGPPPVFRSIGDGEGKGEARPRWSSDDLYRKVFGR